MQDSYGIHWFRRDLRITGNPALQWSLEEHKGRVLGFFCFDRKFLAREDFSHNRFQFFLHTLSELRNELRSVGGDLLVLDVGPDHAFESLFEKLKSRQQRFPATLSWNRDYEPFAVVRDRRIESLLNAYGIKVRTERDHVLIEPNEILKDSTQSPFYQVFTPYQKKWVAALASSEVQDRIDVQRKGLKRKYEFTLNWKTILGEKPTLDDHLDRFIANNKKHVSIELPDAGPRAALKRLKVFSEKISKYSEMRDIPGSNGTSGLSIYFKNGSLTIAQVIAELDLKPFKDKPSSSRDKFLSELIWREFYYYILAHNPRVENQAFLEKYIGLQWSDDTNAFKAWQNGLTGYPIVDAGMRELAATGLMHNRVRMIVASFLTKDLLLNWQWGEKHFMKNLLDGDLAPNNGGWQWAASTGCDPQPYFRIFNPLSQSLKFDPAGDYIRRWIPELRSCGKDIHNPVLRTHYPAPLVSHDTQRLRALKLYRSV